MHDTLEKHSDWKGTPVAMFAKRDLTQGSIPRGLLGFALPLILGNLLQQLYNLADTWVVGRFIGEGALAAVGSA